MGDYKWAAERIADLERQLAEALAVAAIARAEALEEAARVCEAMPIQIYRDDGIGSAGRTCKPATFDDAAEMIRALTPKGQS
jgi:hypothetical protein